MPCAYEIDRIRFRDKIMNKLKSIEVNCFCVNCQCVFVISLFCDIDNIDQIIQRLN